MSLADRVREALAGRVSLEGYTLSALAREIAEELGANWQSVRRQLQRQGVTPADVSAGAVKSPVLREAKMRTAVWDLETTSLKADIGSLLVSAFFDLDGGKIESKTILDFTETIGRDRTWAELERELILWTVKKMLSFDILIGHNTKAFDRNFMNGVIARHGLEPPPQRFHIDTYHVARYGLKGLYQSASLANLADVLKVGGEKDKPAKEDWRLAISGDSAAMERLRIRCEEDVKLNALVWARLKPYWLLWQCRR